jgi:predicted nucleic acid-binding protein
VSAFVLDASVTMSWLLGDAKPADRTYAETVLDSLVDPDCSARVPMTWALEISNVVARAEARGFVEEAQLELALRAGLPLATLDADLSKAARKAGVKRFGPR